MFDRLRRCGAWMSFVCLLAAAPALSAQERPADAVNRAAHLQMLTERIARSYMMLGQGISVPRVRRQLQDDAAAFDADLAALRAMPLNPAQQQNVTRVGELWPALRADARQAPSFAAAQALAQNSAMVAAAAANCTGALQVKVVDRFDAIALAGSTRALSQRMAKLYFYATWGLQPPEGAANFEALQRQFRTNLSTLRIAPQNDDSTLADLDLADSQWVFFSGALAQLGSGEAKMQHMADVGKASDAMLEVLEGLAQKYAASKEQDWAN